MVFLDSGFFIAYRNKRDEYHEHAQYLLAQIINGKIDKGQTCDYVLDEAVTRVRWKTKDPSLAAAVGRDILKSPFWTVRSVPMECVRDCVELYAQHPAEELTFTDWVVQWMAKHYGLTQIITNDEPALKCYERLGFKPVQLLENHAFQQWRERQLSKR